MGTGLCYRASERGGTTILGSVVAPSRKAREGAHPQLFLFMLAKADGVEVGHPPIGMISNASGSVLDESRANLQ